MKDFNTVHLDWKTVDKEIIEFENLLVNNENLEESAIILPFFKKSPNLSALIGKLYFPSLVEINKISYEFDIFGDFKADLVLGDSKNEFYAFIEFEDGKTNSIFKKNQSGKYQRDWSSRFEHGYSQITDWFWKLNDFRQTDAFEDRFGSRNIDFEGILIIGRNSSLQSIVDKKRFKWRRSHTIIQSKKIHCVTYDELLEDLKQQMIFFKNSQ